MCGIFFLCHNVLQISMAGDIRQLGLLNTIGATQKQLSKVYYSQIRRILIPGSVAGVALSAVLLAGIIPLVLGGEYLEKTGGTEGLHIFHPGILLLAILFTDGIVLAASVGVIRRDGGDVLPGERRIYRCVCSEQQQETPGKRSCLHKKETEPGRRNALSSREKYFRSQEAVHLDCALPFPWAGNISVGSG